MTVGEITVLNRTELVEPPVGLILTSYFHSAANNSNQQRDAQPRKRIAKARVERRIVTHWNVRDEGCEGC